MSITGEFRRASSSGSPAASSRSDRSSPWQRGWCDGLVQQHAPQAGALTRSGHEPVLRHTTLFVVHTVTKEQYAVVRRCRNQTNRIGRPHHRPGSVQLGGPRTATSRWTTCGSRIGSDVMLPLVWARPRPPTRSDPPAQQRHHRRHGSAGGRCAVVRAMAVQRPMPSTTDSRAITSSSDSFRNRARSSSREQMCLARSRRDAVFARDGPAAARSWSGSSARTVPAPAGDRRTAR